MNVHELYDDTSPEIWKKVIGEDLHYHVGWGEGDILYNAVKHLYQFIDKESKVLDCGCGWGGPAKAIKRDLHCDVTAITNSPVQYDYIKDSCNKIILREYILKEQNYPRKYLDNWLMTIYYREEIVSLFEKHGYKVTHQKDHYQDALEPTVNYWLENISKVEKEDKTPHILLLEKSSRYLKKHLQDVLNSIELSTLVFER